MMITKRGPYFFADTTMTENPTAQQLADIAVLTANTIKQYNITPRIAHINLVFFH